MAENFPTWITKQMVKGVKGFNLDAYLLALEGWRRGLTLKWYYDPSQVTDMKIIGENPLGTTFSLSSEEKIHFFHGSRGDKITNEALNIVLNKEFIQFKLKDTRIYESIKHDNFKELLRIGESIYIYVISKKTVAASKVVASHVIGDGEKSIKQLIKQKNKLREENPYLASSPIQINDDLSDYLTKLGLTFDSIPLKGERVDLQEIADISTGGEPIGITQIDQQLKDLAVNIVKTVPGLSHGGIKFTLNSDLTVSVGLQPNASISIHAFPVQGHASNVAEEIIDYYFPDTIGLSKDRTKIYFDFREIYRLLKRAVVQELKVTDAPKGKLYAKRYVVSGDVQKKGYRQWIRRQAGKRDLHGYTRNLKNGKVVVVVASENLEKVNKFKSICLRGPRRAKVNNVREYDWTTQIKVGFEIRKTQN